MDFGAIPAQAIDLYWNNCKEILRESFRDRVNIDTIDDYYAPLKAGAMQLWVAYKDNKIIGAVITSIEKGNADTVCMVHRLAGKQMHEWSRLADAYIDAFAKDNKCHAIQYTGREGFTKIFPDLKPDGIIYVRILSYE